jgi:hypothetical protein
MTHCQKIRYTWLAFQNLQSRVISHPTSKLCLSVRQWSKWWITQSAKMAHVVYGRDGNGHVCVYLEYILITSSCTQFLHAENKNKMYTMLNYAKTPLSHKSHSRAPKIEAASTDRVKCLSLKGNTDTINQKQNFPW